MAGIERKSDAHQSERGSFSSGLGMIIATVGVTVGLGSLWRFPSMVALHGGGAFILIYAVFALTFGTALIIAEIALGRKVGKSCLHTYSELSRKWGWIGSFTQIVPALISSYYCVIGGWVLKWFTEASIGELDVLADDGGSFWWSYVTGTGGFLDPWVFFILFTALTIMCIAFGVKNGIERLSRILMPAFVVMVIAITIYQFTLPGIWDGVASYLAPDFSKVTAGTFVAAVSQTFFSMSVGTGVLITFGSYTDKKVNLERAAFSTVGSTLMAAFIIGLMIVPSAFLFGFSEEGGMGLMFETLPQAFMEMPGGEFVAPVFFLMALFVAVTSSVALIEAMVSPLIDMGWSRRRSMLVMSTFIIVMGSIVVLGFNPGLIEMLSGTNLDQGIGVMGVLDTVVNSMIIPVCAILMCAFIGHVMKPSIIADEVKTEGQRFRSERAFAIMIRYVCPAILIVILVTCILDVTGVWTY